MVGWTFSVIFFRYSFFSFIFFFFFSSRRRHTRFDCDWSSDVCSSDLVTRVRKKEQVGEGRPLPEHSKEEKVGEVRRISAHLKHDGVWSVALSRDGRRAFSGGVDGFVRSWDLETGRQLWGYDAERKVRS